MNTEYTVDDITGCWIWGGEFNDDAEPVRASKVKGAKVVARWSIFKETKEIPPGMWVISSCGDKRCVNPDHQEVRQPTPAELSAWEEKKAKKTAEKVQRLRGMLLASLPKSTAALKEYTKDGTTKLNGDPCWEWFWQLNSYGYPVLPWISDDGKSTQVQVVHEVMRYEGKKAPVVEGEEMVVKRLCKNKKCINPAHLKWTTKSSMYSSRFGYGRR
jgi:hypothetical protein